MKEAHRLAIGALSARAGVHVETIRYYERVGLMPAPDRSAARYRLYTPEHLKRLVFVRRARELGFSVDKIRGLLRLVDGHRYTCAEVQALMQEQFTEVRHKIRDLRRLERVMAGMVAQCSGDRIPQCPVIDALFEA
jgi:MerR family mercuric resistance operon transcriptional regulator